MSTAPKDVLKVNGQTIPYIEGSVKCPHLKYNNKTIVSMGDGVPKIDIVPTTDNVSTEITFDVAGSADALLYLASFAENREIVEVIFNQYKYDGIINPFDKSNVQTNTTITIYITQG